MKPSRTVAFLSILFALTVVYFVAGKLGLLVAFVHAAATAVWPPTGIALAAFLLLGSRVWPAILVGAFLVNVTTVGSAATSVGIAIGNTLEAALGAYLVGRFANGCRAFHRAQDVFKFAALAAFLSTALSATIGVSTLSLGGYAAWSDYGHIWLTWWLGDAAGALIVAPLLILWGTNHGLGRLRRRAIEAALLLLSVVVVGEIVFGDLLPPEMRSFPRAYLCLPLLIWSAFRFEPRDVATALFLFSVMATAGALRGIGPFATGSPNESLLYLQVFMATMAVTMLAVAAVIDERRRTAEDRRRSEETFRLAVEAAPNAMIMVDERGRITLVNAHAELLFGYTRQELLGQSVELLVPRRFHGGHPEDRAGFFTEPQTRAMGTGRDLYAVRKDGSEVPVEIGLNPIKTSAGLFVLAAVVDISQRKRAEDALREGEERLRLAVEAGQMGTWDWKIGSGDIRWSPALEAIHGRPPGSFPGTFEAFQADIHPEDRETVRRAIAEALERGEHRVEYRIIRPDGEVRWVEGRGRVSYDAEGCPQRMLGICMDVTEPKRAGEERERLLRQEQALSAREKAARAEEVAANRAKDEFLAIVSHELRTPLNAILGWARMLRSGRMLPEAAERALESIERNTQVQAQLIEDLLDISRIISGKLTFDMRPVELRVIVEAAVDAVKDAAQAAEIQLRADLDRSAERVSGDPIRLQQVFWNLLSNAIKFTDRGGRIDVRLRPVGRWAEVVVQDSGRGINPDFLPYVFELFRQDQPSTAGGRGSGLGIGLAVVRHLVERHGGAVEAASLGEGQGSTFTVRLPLIPASDASRNTPSVKDNDRKSNLARSTLEGLRILIADDDADTRELIGAVLAAAGAEMTSAGSAKEAREILEMGQIDVLISDIAMPGADGYELIRHVRATQRLENDLVAIALTAHARNEDRALALSAGFDLYHSKPADLSDLVNEIARATVRLRKT